MSLADSLITAITERIGLRPEFSRPKVEAALAHMTYSEREAWTMNVLNAPQSSKEWGEFAELFLVHETYFFRHPPQLQFLSDFVLPELLKEKLLAGKIQLRAWCAACSSGEEAYSLGLLLRDAIAQHPKASALRWDVSIVGTDISAEMIERGTKGEYTSGLGLNSFRDVPLSARHHFPSIFSAGETVWRADETLRQTVSFQRRNLLEDAAPFKDIDLILCRNALIYFDEIKSQAILAKMESALRPGGVLVLGPADTLRRTAGFTRLTDDRAMFWKKKELQKP